MLASLLGEPCCSTYDAMGKRRLSCREANPPRPAAVVEEEGLFGFFWRGGDRTATSGMCVRARFDVVAVVGVFPFFKNEFRFQFFPFSSDVLGLALIRSRILVSVAG